MPGELGQRLRAARGTTERDARLYLRTLYHGQPESTVIAVGAFTRPHFVYTPDDALAWVVGKHDVYARIALLAGKPARGRGTAADSAYLPGAWAEVDINGGPRSNGGVVTDGAADLDAAVELAHAVLQPTMLVRSGYGLHAYWLFDEPLDIREHEARERAGELVAGWQRRMKSAAAELGITLDSTHDLARVFRPAGTFNGKGGEPVPVTLLDDGGPRYTPEQIKAEALAPVVSLVAATPEPGQGRKPDELLSKYAALGRIARREGKAPGKGSESDWDYYLACEARRRVKPPIGREEAIELVAHGRRKHGDDPKGKAERGDYLEATVDKAFAQVEAPATTAPAGADPASAITAAWKIDNDPVVAGWSQGYGLEATVYMRRAGGDVVSFERLGDLFTATRHVAQVSLELPGVAVPDITKPTAVRIAQAIIQLCDVQRDHGDRARHELEAWLGSFVQWLGTVVEGDLLGEGAPRWRVLVAQRDYKPDEVVHGIAAATAGVRDLAGRLWIPAGAFMRHIRKVESAPIDWRTLDTRLLDLGWERLRVDVHEPHSGSKVGVRHIRATFYGEPGTSGES